MSRKRIAVTLPAGPRIADTVDRIRWAEENGIPDAWFSDSGAPDTLTQVAAIAHQTHGAMGFTYEHSLHHATRRLWAWRDEFGNESHWAIMLGRIVAARGADELWPFVTGD